MSRLAKKPIILPAGTDAYFSGGVLTVKGPLGSLQKSFKGGIAVDIKDKAMTISVDTKVVLDNALLGTYVSHAKNMVAGVQKLYEKKLIVEGIGFKADVKGKDLVLAVGFSHSVSVPIPTSLKVTSEKNTVTVSGIDAEEVGQFSAKVRAVKKPEPYLGKGIRYVDEVIRKKQGKKAV